MIGEELSSSTEAVSKALKDRLVYDLTPSPKSPQGHSKRTLRIG